MLRFIDSVLLFFIRPLFRLLAKLFYGRKKIGAEQIPRSGGVILVANRSSALDEIFVTISVSRPVLFYNPEQRPLRRFLSGGRTLAAAGEVRTALAQGKMVCVFPEKHRTRTGQLGTFSDDFLQFFDRNAKTPTPILPTFIGGLLGSFWSLSFRRNRWFSLRRLAEQPFVAFGAPLEISPNQPLTTQRVLYALEELGVGALDKIDRRLDSPQSALLKNCRKKGRRLLMADSLGVKMSGYSFLIRALIARRLLKREVLERGERNVGLLVPMSVGGCVVNAALSLDRRVSVNLNNTFGSEILDYCIHQAEIKRILTSRKMLERFPQLKLDAPFVCLEDLFGKVKWWDKTAGLFDAVVLPRWLLKWKLGLTKIADTDPLSIIFTSGSTGKPKGVVLSHRNISYVARGFFETIRIRYDDIMLGVLPFFHAFGYVGNFWLVILSGCTGIFHYNPLEAKTVGQVSRKYGCTFIPITPTFLRHYLKRCPKEDFAELKTVLTGAEKLPLDLITAWEEKFGARPTEGYGATELAPCPMVNIPEVRFPFDTPEEKAAFQSTPTPADRSIGGFGGQIYRKDLSAGRPFVGTAVKIVDPESGADLPPGEVGMMVVKGPFVTTGYYRQPDKTAEAIHDGWYRTGDMAKRDADGFIWITGRQNRISKIGGEMVPHVLIEEVIDRLIRTELAKINDLTEDGLYCAVSALPDERKGEKIIVLLRHATLDPETIRRLMRAEKIPNLWIPDADGFIDVEEIPILGTGKLDLAAVQKIVQSANFH